MKKTTGTYPAPAVDAAGAGVALHAGLLLATEADRALVLDGELSTALALWRKPLALHDRA